MALRRWITWVREVARVMRGEPDDELRRRSQNLHEQLIRLRNHRNAQMALREKTALNDLRRIVEEMKDLERNLTETEKATAKYVGSLAEEVKGQLEADLNAEANAIIDKLEKNSSSVTSAENMLKNLRPEGSSGGAASAETTVHSTTKSISTP